MARSDDFFHDMDTEGKMTDRDVERLLRSRGQVDGEDSELARFLRDFEVVYPAPAVDHCRTAHLSGIFAAAHETDVDDPVAAGVQQARRPGSRTPEPAPEGRRFMARRFPRWLLAKLTIPVVIILVAFGGAALAGGLVYNEVVNNSPGTTVTGSEGVDVDEDLDDVDEDLDDVDEDLDDVDEDLDDVEDETIEDADDSDLDDIDDEAIDETDDEATEHDSGATETD